MAPFTIASRREKNLLGQTILKGRRYNDSCNDFWNKANIIILLMKAPFTIASRREKNLLGLTILKGRRDGTIDFIQHIADALEKVCN